MHYADIKKADIANGLGVRVSVFVSGCTHHCKNCFNSEAWDFNYGNEFTENEINRVIKELDHSYVSGLSVLGGEPLEHVNQQGLLPLLKRVKEKFPDKTFGVIQVIPLKQILWEKCIIIGKKHQKFYHI